MNWTNTPPENREDTYVQLPTQIKNALDRADDPQWLVISRAVAKHVGIGEKDRIRHELEQTREQYEELLDKADEKQERIQHLEERLEQLEEEQASYQQALEDKADYFLTEQPHADILPSAVESIATDYGKTTDEVLDDLVAQTDINEDRINRNPTENPGQTPRRASLNGGGPR